MTEIKFPFGNADEQALTTIGDQDLIITDMLTVIDGVTVIATDERTLNLTASDLQVGAMLFFKSKTTATETLVFGTGMLGKTLTGVAGKTFGGLFIYDGTNFVQASTPIQVD